MIGLLCKNHMYNYYVVTSALCFSLSFVVTPLSVMLMPSAFMLIFTLILKDMRQLSFRFGFLWGCIVYSIQILPILTLTCSTYTHLSHLFLRVLLWFSLMLYTALHAGIWFVLLRMSSAHITHIAYKLFFTVSITWLFIIWLDCGFLWPFGLFEGYACIYPLVPLSHFLPVSLFAYGKSVLFFGFLIFCAVLSALSFAHNRVAFITVCFFWLLLMVIRIWPVGRTEKRPYWLNTVTRIVPPWSFEPDSYPWQRARILGNLIKTAVLKNAQTELIVFPEAAFQYELNKYPEMFIFWQDILEQNRVPDAHIIIGAHRRIGSLVYNSCFYISHGLIQNVYDKRHGLLWIERVPSWSSGIHCAEICVPRQRLFAQSNAKDTRFSWKNIVFKPLICSDNFFSRTSLTDNEPRHVMLCLVNDAWCSTSFLADILYQTVYLHACCTQLPVLYISYTRGVYIDENQHEFELPFC